MEQPTKIFDIKVDKLYSPEWKIKEVTDNIQNNKPSKTEGAITVSKLGNGKYFVMDGNHRVIQAIKNGTTSVQASLNPHIPDMTRSGGGYDSHIKSAVQVISIVDNKITERAASNALPDGETTYQDNVKYHGNIPELTYINPQLIQRRDSFEVSSVSPEVAAQMVFDEPIQVSLFRDGEILCDNGHHRLAAAKQLGMKFIYCEVVAINAYGQNINKLLQAQSLKENIMKTSTPINESNELIMKVHFDKHIAIDVLESLWKEATSQQEKYAKTTKEKDKGNPKFWAGVKGIFGKLINDVDIHEAKEIVMNRSQYSETANAYLDALQNDDYVKAQEVFPKLIDAKLKSMINVRGKEFLKTLGNKEKDAKK